MAIRGEKRILGFRGEERAAKYMKGQGYTIVKRNYKCPCGEVDIIAERGEVLAFVEVKTRTNDDYGAPNEAVNGERQRRYKNCVRYFFLGREIDCTVRFDIIEVTKEGINHIENAFY